MSEQAPVPNTYNWRKNIPIAALALTAAVASGSAVYESRRANYAIEQQADQLRGLQKQNQRTNRILGSEHGVDENVITGESLSMPDTMPGAGFPVSTEVRNALQNATIKLGSGRKSSVDGGILWDGSCTGTKVISAAGNAYILSAAHCFKDETAISKKGVSGPLAVNVVRPQDMYAVLDPNLTVSDRQSAKPLAIVDGIAVDRSGTTDIALLSVKPVPVHAEQFNSIPAIPLDSYSVGGLGGLNSQITPGQPVALDGMPASNWDEHVRDTGVYLGQYDGSELSGISNQIDLVAIAAPTYEDDACNYGASGSQAAYLRTDGGLGMTGPLSLRNSIGYGAEHTFYEPDTAETGVQMRLKIEAMTSVNLDRYDTICGYSVPQQATLDNLQQVLGDPSRVIVFESGK
jgi:hypothetical protein